MVELRNLRYFVTLARIASYARASQELRISQPSLTRAIQRLERNLALRLFDRDRSGVTLTMQGQTIFERATAILLSAEELERESQMMAGGHYGRIRFGFAPQPAAVLLRALLKQRLENFPNVTNDVRVRNVDALWPLLFNGDIEFLVCAEQQVPDNAPVRAEILGVVPVSLLVNSRHPLLSRESERERFPVIVSSARALPLPEGLEMIAEGEAHIIEDYATLGELVKCTDSICVMTRSAVIDEIRDGKIVVLPSLGYGGGSGQRLVMYTLSRRAVSQNCISIRDVMKRLLRAI